MSTIDSGSEVHLDEHDMIFDTTGRCNPKQCRPKWSRTSHILIDDASFKVRCLFVWMWFSSQSRIAVHFQNRNHLCKWYQVISDFNLFRSIITQISIYFDLFQISIYFVSYNYISTYISIYISIYHSSCGTFPLNRRRPSGPRSHRNVQSDLAKVTAEQPAI